MGFPKVVAGTLPAYADAYDRFVNGSYAQQLRAGTARPPPSRPGDGWVPAARWRPRGGGGGGGGAALPEQALDVGTRHFYVDRVKTALEDNHNLVKKSLYLFQYRHWLSVLGQERVAVVTTEEVVQDQAKALRGALQFVGLCPFKFGNLGRDNVTPFEVRGNFRIDEPTFKALAAFFAPYNKALYALVGRDLGWESKTFQDFR